MKKTIVFLCSLMLSNLAFAQHENHSAPKAETNNTAAKPKSPRTSAMAMIGSNHVHIDYGSPSVRGRTIWGGLVAYDQVWATGAHKATWIDFGQDVKINGKLISKGKYGFFAIPNKDEWTLIISKIWDMHLADDYDPSNDILRLKVKPKKLEATVEALTFEVKPTNKKTGAIQLSWDKISVAFQFENLN